MKLRSSNNLTENYKKTPTLSYLKGTKKSQIKLFTSNQSIVPKPLKISSPHI